MTAALLLIIIKLAHNVKEEWIRPEGLNGGEETLLLVSECLTSSPRPANWSPGGTVSDKDVVPFVGVSGLLVSLIDLCSTSHKLTY